MEYQINQCHKNFAGRFYNIMMVPCKMNPDHDQAFKAIDFSLLRILSVHKECIVRTSVIVSLGGRCSILDLLIWKRGVAIFKLSYSYV